MDLEGRDGISDERFSSWRTTIAHERVTQKLSDLDALTLSPERCPELLSEIELRVEPIAQCEAFGLCQRRIAPWLAAEELGFKFLSTTSPLKSLLFSFLLTSGDSLK